MPRGDVTALSLSSRALHVDSQSTTKWLNIPHPLCNVMASPPRSCRGVVSCFSQARACHWPAVVAMPDSFECVTLCRCRVRRRPVPEQRSAGCAAAGPSRTLRRPTFAYRLGPVTMADAAGQPWNALVSCYGRHWRLVARSGWPLNPAPRACTVL